jgi:SAM-dependent methyltransferase
VISAVKAAEWTERWERQQEHYAGDREQRMDVMADVVRAATDGRPRPLIADLGCGPGSLAARILARVPSAEIVAVDVDPVLLALGRATQPPAVRFAEVLIGAPGWVEDLGLDRPLDAVVASTVLHYPDPQSLRGIYRDLARALRPDAVLLNGDNFPLGAGLAGLAVGGGPRASGEDWPQWWAAVARDGDLAELYERRRDRLPPSEGDGNGLTIAQHVRLLREVGFCDAGPLWQHGESAVVAAVR